MSRKNTMALRRTSLRRSHTKRIILSLVTVQKRPTAAGNRLLIRSSGIRTVTGETIIVDKGEFYLIQKGDRFICMKRGARRDTTHAIFHTLDDGLFHMDNEH